MTPTDINAADAHDLRRRVLRDGDPDASVEWAGDREATTFHLGLCDDAGRIVAISTWLARPDPTDHASDTSRRATQLRGMATDPGFAGSGLGSQLLVAGMERCRRHRMEVVWANARVTALSFYGRAGFDIVGPVFETSDTGLPHRLIRAVIR